MFYSTNSDLTQGIQCDKLESCTIPNVNKATTFYLFDDDLKPKSQKGYIVHYSFGEEPNCKTIDTSTSNVLTTLSFTSSEEFPFTFTSSMVSYGNFTVSLDNSNKYSFSYINRIEFPSKDIKAKIKLDKDNVIELENSYNYYSLYTLDYVDSLLLEKNDNQGAIVYFKNIDANLKEITLELKTKDKIVSTAKCQHNSSKLFLCEFNLTDVNEGNYHLDYLSNCNEHISLINDASIKVYNLSTFPISINKKLFTIQDSIAINSNESVTADIILKNIENEFNNITINVSSWPENYNLTETGIFDLFYRIHPSLKETPMNIRISIQPKVSISPSLDTCYYIKETPSFTLNRANLYALIKDESKNEYQIEVTNSTLRIKTNETIHEGKYSLIIKENSSTEELLYVYNFYVNNEYCGSSFITKQLPQATLDIINPPTLKEGTNKYYITSGDYYLPLLKSITIFDESNSTVEITENFSYNESTNLIEFELNIDLNKSYTLHSLTDEENFEKEINYLLSAAPSCLDGLLMLSNGTCVLPEEDIGNDTINKCENYCQNGASCKIENNSPICTCDNEHYGLRCAFSSTEINKTIDTIIASKFNSSETVIDVKNKDTIIEIKTI